MEQQTGPNLIEEGCEAGRRCWMKREGNGAEMKKPIRDGMGCETIYQSSSQCTVCLICGMPASQ